MSNPLAAISDQLTATVAEVSKSVVAIHARPRFTSSGVVLIPGVIVTADHTIRRDEDIKITTPAGTAVSAELVGRDPGTDLAVLRAEGLDAPAAAWAENFTAQPGALIIGVGRWKDSAIASLGLLSSISPASSTWRGGHLDQVIRLDLQLHPGASGGAVVNAEGKLIGIETGILSRVSVFAIPRATVERVVQQLLAHGRIPRGYLGIGLQPIALPEHQIQKLARPAGTALIVISVGTDTPAAGAGLLIGDILLELGGRVVHTPEDVHDLLSSQSPGGKLRARILRGGEPMEVDVTVGERPRKAGESHGRAGERPVRG
jgi:S1-C subfamily serine protease